ncbi:UNVERIFIED_CONTAM: hypothetical protein GTU68_043506 [Idotea baltica]|nr:hypothetical protein [Idotea baltica]
MCVGLGTGSTAYFAIKKLGERVQQGLKIQAVATSLATEKLAKEENIPLIPLSDVDSLDMTIDGADEFDPNLNLVKGGGGALFREKLIASLSNELIIITDARKEVPVLGAFPLPVEIVVFGWEITQRRIQKMGAKATVRMNGNEPFLTDNGNYILDCEFGPIHDPAELHISLIQLVGVVETGLFIGMTSMVIVGNEQGESKIFNAKNQ